MRFHFHKITLLWVFLSFFLSQDTTAQVYLQMEKAGSTRSHKIPAGTEITFQLKGRDYYITEEIRDFRPEEGVVITESEVFFTDQIAALIPADHYHRKGRFFIYPLYTFGATATVAGLVGTGYEKKLRPGLLIPGPASFAAGWLLQKWLDRPYKTGNKYRFRIVDLRMKVEDEKTPRYDRP